ncbi:MAG TPA: LON peptidase substrate-binding domain-containing protein [Gemmata sp.]|nr:LON peptidase substrate-binding domain-containing protein [Gemmata sp.]
MIDEAAILENFGGILRLFPLPNLVLFPGVVQGLHIFEPRYRQMTAESLADDSLLGLVMLKRGWEDDYEDRPPIEEVACLGRISWHEELPDGRYNLRLRGLARVKILAELPSPLPYRTARVEILPETGPPSAEELKTFRGKLAEVVLPRFTDDGDAKRQLEDLFDSEMSLGQVCDVLAYAMPLPAEFKQSMLEEPHAGRRAAALVDAIRLTAARADRKFPPDFSSN